MSQKAKINPEILKWARKTARITLEKAAATISKTCKVERIKEWESSEGKDLPSIKQVEKLARLYRRPAEVFYLQYIPKDFPPLKDFRSNKDEELTTALVFMMREIQEKQEWLSAFLSGKREKKLDFAGKYNIKDNPEDIAKEIRKVLGISSAFSKKSSTADKPLKHWINCAESKRIFVSLSSNYHTRLKLDSDSFKGFVIADKFAPFIFLNSEDWEHSQLFTLIHELAHIWIGVSGISSDTELPFASKKVIHPVEKFCRTVAANALLPETELKENVSDSEDLTLKNISRISRKYGVSNTALLNRLTDIGYTNKDHILELHKEADNAWNDFLFKESQKKKPSGGPNYYIMQLRRSSKAFAGIVMDNYKRGKVNGADASRLLKVKEGNFEKFEKYIYK